MSLNKENVIDKLKRRYNIIGYHQDKDVHDAVNDAVAHYKAIVNQLNDTILENVPEAHEFIIVDVASKRYGRSGSESLTVERVDQYQAQYASPETDFDAYMPILVAMYGSEDDHGAKRGKVTFY